MKVENPIAVSMEELETELKALRLKAQICRNNLRAVQDEIDEAEAAKRCLQLGFNIVRKG